MYEVILSPVDEVDAAQVIRTSDPFTDVRKSRGEVGTAPTMKLSETVGSEIPT